MASILFLLILRVFPYFFLPWTPRNDDHNYAFVSRCPFILILILAARAVKPLPHSLHYRGEGRGKTQPMPYLFAKLMISYLKMKMRIWMTVNRTRVCILMFASQKCQKSEVFRGRTEPWARQFNGIRSRKSVFEFWEGPWILKFSKFWRNFGGYRIFDPVNFGLKWKYILKNLKINVTHPKYD